MAHNTKKPDDNIREITLWIICAWLVSFGGLQGIQTQQFHFAVIPIFWVFIDTLFFNAYLVSFLNSLNCFGCKGKTGFDLLDESHAQAYSKKADEQ